MNDFSDIFYLLGAIVIVSLLSLQINRFINTNESVYTQAVLEENVIRITQLYSDRIKWINSEQQLEDFISTFPITETVVFDAERNLSLDFDITVSARDTVLTGASVDSKLIRIVVESQNFASDSPYTALTKVLKTF
ncbi:MAG: hypothetical protein LAT84_09895 [Balneolia bacterium]|nr:hypothetical protein [Balneolia bacterium]